MDYRKTYGFNTNEKATQAIEHNYNIIKKGITDKQLADLDDDLQLILKDYLETGNLDLNFIEETQAEADQKAAKEKVEAEAKTAEEAYAAEKLAAQTIPNPKYQQFRAEEFPNYVDVYLDAQVKKASPDPKIQAEGVAQEQKYYEDSLAVKAKYPKFVE
jgi:hypothetical protein